MQLEVSDGDLFAISLGQLSIPIISPIVWDRFFQDILELFCKGVFTLFFFKILKFYFDYEFSSNFIKCCLFSFEMTELHLQLFWTVLKVFTSSSFQNFERYTKEMFHLSQQNSEMTN